MPSTATHSARIGPQEKLSMWLLAAVVLLGAIGSAFAAGFVIGRMLL
jgi:hypothetical protein